VSVPRGAPPRKGHPLEGEKPRAHLMQHRYDKDL
jgi:hypothetical protein